MKAIPVLVVAVMLTLLLTVPALAASLSISPEKVEFEVPADGSAEVTFTAFKYNGDLTIDCENIPLKVEPTTVSVKAKEGGDTFALTFYGDESLGSKIYEGKIRFLATTGGMVAMGIKVRASVTNLVEGETPVLATIEESQQPFTETQNSGATQAIQKPTVTLPEEGKSGAQVIGPEQSSSELPPQGKTEWPILPIVGIVAATIVAVTLIIVLLRRPRY